MSAHCVRCVYVCRSSPGIARPGGLQASIYFAIPSPTRPEKRVNIGRVPKKGCLVFHCGKPCTGLNTMCSAVCKR